MSQVNQVGNSNSRLGQFKASIKFVVQGMLGLSISVLVKMLLVIWYKVSKRLLYSCIIN